MDAELKNDGMIIDYQRVGRTGKVRLTARFPDGKTYTDKIDSADAAERDRFIKVLCKDRPGIDRGAVAEELERIASDGVEQSDEGCEDTSSRSAQADQLVELARDAELFHTPGGHDSEGYATIAINNHRETWPIAGRGFRRWLAHSYFQNFGKAPGAQPIQDALSVLAGMAIHEGGEKSVAVRMVEYDGDIWLDLADNDWRAVRISASGWRVVAGDDVPVRFLRRRGMLTLPLPISGGSIDELRGLVNMPDDDMWVMYVAWLVGALRPGRPIPVLTVNGEQGSAKSTASKMARALIDPNVAPLRRPPRDERDLMIAAMNGWVVAFDNLSGVPPWLSDTICTLATGGGFATRELYSDGDEKLFDATRPVILNGIDDLATRSDLLDRSVNLTLPEIPEDKRRDEGEVWSRFAVARPRILGALLDAASAALRNLPSMKLQRLPRMADFAKWVVAAEPALPWPPGTFIQTYNRNRISGNVVALESSVIGPVIVRLMQAKGEWRGMAGELLVELESHHADERSRRHRDWPTSPRKLSGDLRRLAPNLRRSGINVVFEGHTRRGAPIRLEWTCNEPSPPSQPSRPSNGKELHRDDGVTVGDGPGFPTQATPSPENSLDSRPCDGGDGCDGLLQVQSDDRDFGGGSAGASGQTSTHDAEDGALRKQSGVLP